MPSTVIFPEAEALMAEVQASSALSDYGDGDIAPDLKRFLENVDRQPGLSEATRARLLGQARQRLTNRLQIEQWYHDHPELEQTEAPEVVSITGLPRTGTTALVNLMSMDEQLRPLRSWEQSQSCPPPVLGEEVNDPRRLQALAGVERMLRERPEMAALHLYDVDATEEDFEVLGASFRAQQLALPIYQYHAWWRHADLSAAFAYHRRVLRLLQSRRPPYRWMLKAPAHLFHMEALFGAYPNAKVIVTHRDPAKVMPSATSLLLAMYPPEFKADPMTVGRETLQHYLVGVERAKAAREAIGDDRFLDVQHRDLVKTPVATLERIYDFLGMEFRLEMRKKVEAWLAENSSGAHGVHHYTPEEFGFTAEGLRAEFGDYIERFNVAG